MKMQYKYEYNEFNIEIFDSIAYNLQKNLEELPLVWASNEPLTLFAMIFGRTKRSFNFGLPFAVNKINLSCFTAPSFSRSSASLIKIGKKINYSRTSWKSVWISIYWISVY